MEGCGQPQDTDHSLMPELIKVYSGAPMEGNPYDNPIDEADSEGN